MKFSIAPFIGRIYILLCAIVATIISVLIIYQCYNSKLFSDSPLLKLIIPIIIITGLYGLILPTQVPHKIGITPDPITQKYLDVTTKKKLKYRIAPNDKIEVYEIPRLIWRQKVIYIGIALLTIDQCNLANIITNTLESQSVNILRQELSFWQGVASVTTNSFQLWKPFTKWYIQYLSKFVDSIDYSFESNIFNSYIINKIKNRELDVFEDYVRPKNKSIATLCARQLDKSCAYMWTAAYALLTDTELSVKEKQLPKYQDVCQLANLSIIEDLSPQKVINGLNERLNSNLSNTELIQLDKDQSEQICSHIVKNCPLVEVVEVTKVKLQWVTQIPSFIIICRKRKSIVDLNEHTKLIEKQLQSVANNLDGDWTILVVYK